MRPDALLGRPEDVAEGEHAGVVDQDVDREAVGLRAVVQFAGRLRRGPGRTRRSGGRAPRSGPPVLRLRTSPFRAVRWRLLSHEYEVVPQGREPPGITAPDARSGAAHQRPACAGPYLSAPHPTPGLHLTAACRLTVPRFCDSSGLRTGRYFVRALHQGRRLSSSTILRGRSGQCLQHFMSTEYIRAMQ